MAGGTGDYTGIFKIPDWKLKRPACGGNLAPHAVAICDRISCLMEQNELLDRTRDMDLLERIHQARGRKVMFDVDLAAIYEVPTKRLNEQVRRNKSRFPADFMFQLTHSELLQMRSQNVTASKRNLRHPPFAFTELGVAMLSSVLHSERAIQANIAIMRTFVELRRGLQETADPAKAVIAIFNDIRLTARRPSVRRSRRKRRRKVEVLAKIQTD